MFRRAAGDNSAAFVSAAGTHVDNVIGIADYVQIMFDNNNRGAVFNKFLKNFHQGLNVERMQADGRFIKNKYGI